MGFYELRERGGENATSSGRRVTEKIQRVKQMIEEILHEAEQMEYQYGERNGGYYGERDNYGERDQYGERDNYGERRMRDSRGRFTNY